MPTPDRRFPLLRGLQAPSDAGRSGRGAPGARGRGARGDHRHGQPTRPPGREPGDGRPDDRPPRRAGVAARPYHGLGHQAYGHKLLTGRLQASRASPARRHQRLPAPRRERARHHGRRPRQHLDQLRHGPGRGAPRPPGGPCGVRHRRRRPTGGMAYEGLNQAGALRSPITVLLNDNGMGIPRTSAPSRSSSSACASTPPHQGARGDRARPAKLPGATRMGGDSDATKSLWSRTGRSSRARLRLLRPDRRPRHGEVRKALRTTLEMDAPW